MKRFIYNTFFRQEDKFPDATLGDDYKQGCTIELEEGNKIHVWLTTTGLLNADEIVKIPGSYDVEKGIFGYMKVKEFHLIDKGILFETYGKQYYLTFYVIDNQCKCKFIGQFPEDLHSGHNMNDTLQIPYNSNFAVC